MATSGSSTEVDAVVVGGGAAGLAAALWLARYRRSVVVLDSGDYRAAKVEASYGYLGCRGSTSTTVPRCSTARPAMAMRARDRDIVALGWDAHLVGFACTTLN